MLAMQTSFYNKKLTQSLTHSADLGRTLLNDHRYSDLIPEVHNIISQLPKIDDDVWNSLIPEQIDSCGLSLASLSQYLCEAHLKTGKTDCEPDEIENLLAIRGILLTLIHRGIVFSKRQNLTHLKTSLSSWSRYDEKALLARLGIDLRRHTRFFQYMLHPEYLIVSKLLDRKNASLIGKKLNQIIIETGNTDALNAIECLIERELKAIEHLDLNTQLQSQIPFTPLPAEATTPPDPYIAFSHTLAHHMQPPNSSIRLENLSSIINASQFLANFWSYAEQIKNEISSNKDLLLEKLRQLQFRGIPEKDKLWLEEGRRLLISFANSNPKEKLPPAEVFHLIHSSEAYTNALQLKKDLGSVSEFMIWRSVLEKIGWADPLRLPREIYDQFDQFMLQFKSSLQQ